MININHLKAGYLLAQLWVYLVEVKTFFAAWYIHTPFILPALIILVVIAIILFILRKLWNIKEQLQQRSIFLELTPPAFTDKSSYTTQQLFSVLHHLGSQKTFWDRMLGKKALFSFEIASTKEQGIRYIVRTTIEEAQTIERTIVSYLPQVRVKCVDEYLENGNLGKAKVIEFKLRKHYAFPLSKQNVLNQHDPVAYITGMMTKLEPGELISFQIVVSAIKKKETELLSHKILRNEDVLGYLNKPQIPLYIQPFILIFKTAFKLVHVATRELGWAITEVAHGASSQQNYIYNSLQQQNQLIAQRMKPARVLSSFEQETVMGIQQKIEQELFETTIRAFIFVQDADDRKERVRGIKSSLAPFSVPKYQSLKALYNFPPLLTDTLRLFTFKHRLLSMFSNKSSSLLSVSEIADLYHFPYTQTTQTENIVKALNRELPAPLSLKNNRDLAVVFGKKHLWRNRNINWFNQRRTGNPYVCYRKNRKRKDNHAFFHGKARYRERSGYSIYRSAW